MMKIKNRINITKFVPIILFYIGVILGSVLMLLNSETVLNDSFEILESYFSKEKTLDFASVFFKIMSAVFLEIIIIFLMGTSTLGKYLIYAFLTLKGFSYALDFGIIYLYLGSNGILAVAVCLLPQTLLFMAIYYFYCNRAIENAVYIVKGRARSKELLKTAVIAMFLSVLPIIYDTVSVVFLLKNFSI